MQKATTEEHNEKSTVSLTTSYFLSYWEKRKNKECQYHTKQKKKKK
jgi:hypothetical protein